MNFIQKYITSIVVVISFASAFSGYFFYHQSQLNREVALYVNNSSLTSNKERLAVIASVPDTILKSIAPNGEAPNVESKTHPDSSRWYSNNNPSFSWPLPKDIEGVSFLITDKANSNPGPKSDGIVSSTSFSGISDGTKYFNIKFKENGIWGLITHYQFNTDTVSPEKFTIKTIPSGDSKTELAFGSTDSLSGIDHYEIKVGERGGWVTIPSTKAEESYGPISHRFAQSVIYIKAVDKAGNTTIESVTLEASGSGLFSILGTGVTSLFNNVVNFLSSYILLLMLLLIFIGVLVLIYQLLSSHVDRLWIHLDNRRLKNNTPDPQRVIKGLAKNMKEEISSLDLISQSRRLSKEERQLKLKLTQSLKTLEKKGR